MTNLKKFAVFACSLIALIFTANLAVAAPSAGLSVPFKATTINTVPSVTWTPIVTSLTKGIKGIQIFNQLKKGATPVAVEVGIATAGSAADSEVAQMVIPASQTDVGIPGAQFYPLAVGYGVRVSIRVVQDTSGAIANAGVFNASFLYN